MFNARATGLTAFLFFMAMPAFADPPRDIDALVSRAMQLAGVPGMAVAIVEHGQVTLARGYGVRRLGSADSVDADTIFEIGSLSKAFTAAALAVLVDRGKIRWDDPVIDHIPGFQMYDPWVTREITVLDLLVHRSGLGACEGDLLFFPRTTLSRAEGVRRLRYLRPATSFRYAYAYDNILYVAAGQLIEDVSGRPWEEFVRDNLLVPAGMRTATSSLTAWRATVNRAWPHGRRNGPIIGVGDQQLLDTGAPGEYGSEPPSQVAPAGGIAASANDMARWLQIQLARGTIPGGSARLFSEASSRTMWTSVVNMPIPQYPGAIARAAPQFLSYALGWEISDYHGHRMVSHGGYVPGSLSLVVLIPNLDVGFVILENSESDETRMALQYELLDHYLQQPEYDWAGAWSAVAQEQRQAAVKAVQSPTTTRAAVGPSLPLDRYAGDYADAWYGAMSITEVEGRLVMDFKHSPGMVGDLEHWQYDTFRVTWRDPLVEPAYVTFALGPGGEVQRISMRAVSPRADFSWDYPDLDFRPARK
jgi:CubicO group peptidase (beta-lactamase class C family)